MSRSHASLSVSRSRVEKVTLPPASKWNVAAEDVLIAANLTSTIRRKTLLFTRTSPVMHRSITITKQGYMIVYDSEERGYVICLKDALKIKTSTVALMRKTTDDSDWNGFFSGAKRTQIEVKMCWGSVVMSVLGWDAVPWLRAFNKFTGTSDQEENIVITSQPMPEEEKIPAATSTEEEDVSESEVASLSSTTSVVQDVWRTEKPPAAASSLSCPAPTKTSSWRRLASPLPPTTTLSDPTADFSIRRGEHSVATLRNILARKAALSLQGRAKRRRTLYN